MYRNLLCEFRVSIRTTIIIAVYRAVLLLINSRDRYPRPGRRQCLNSGDLKRYVIISNSVNYFTGDSVRTCTYNIIYNCG